MEGTTASLVLGQAQPKQFLCVFCKDPHFVPVGDFDKFKYHLSENHKIHNELEIVLAVQFLDAEENEEIVIKIRSRWKSSLIAAGYVSQQKKVCCIFCKELPSIHNEKVNEHMKSLHKLYFGNKTMIAVTLLTELEKMRILQRVRNKAEHKDEFKEKGIWNSSKKKRLCRFCGKRFKTEMKQTAHESFRCNICGKCFMRQESLKSHTLNKKNAYRPCLKPSYNCEKCGKGFEKETRLETHMQQKCFRQAIKCEDCEQFFTLGLFNVHKKRRRTCKKTRHTM